MVSILVMFFCLTNILDVSGQKPQKTIPPHLVGVTFATRGKLQTKRPRATTTPRPIAVSKIKDVSDDKLQEFINQMWEADSNKFDIEDYIEFGLPHQEYPLGRLFELDELKIFDDASRPTVNGLKGVYALYDNRKLNTDPVNLTLVVPWLQEIIRTGPMKILKSVLIEYKYKDYDENTPDTEFIQELKRIWFSQFKHPTTQVVTSAFSHVFIGEYGEKTFKIGGLHSWLRYVYLQREKECKSFHYNGYYVHEKNIFTIGFRIGKSVKNKGSMFYGTNPEFDMALYTLCYMAKPGDKECKFNLPSDSNKKIRIEVTSLEEHTGDRIYLKTVFPDSVTSDSTSDTA